MTLLAVRLIDLAIFGSLGGLWIGGAIFIVVLYRWILRFERGEGSTSTQGEPVGEAATQVRVEPPRSRARGAPPTAAAREALASHS